MCYAIPGRVKEIQDKRVIVDYFGEEKKALNEFYDLRVGDYICAQGGYVIKKVSPQEAESILSAWSELFFDLQSIDLRLSQLDFQGQKIDKKLRLILDRALEKTQLSKEDLLYLFNLRKVTDINLLFKVANFLRHKFHKNSCCVHGIIEISNSCQRLCSYCGISADNKEIKRYRMSAEEIVNIATEAVKKYGFQALVLQSAEDPAYAVKDLAAIIKKIKEQAEVLIAISFGEVGLDGLKELYQAGARAILLRFETSNPEIYKRLHPGRTLDSRLNHIKKAYEIGYLIMTGALIGLPGQSDEDIINDLYLTKALGAEMYSFGPFLPHPNTFLRDCSAVSEEKVLKTLALARIIDPENSKILVTTAFETLSSEARKKGLVCGANSVMLNITPLEYRKLYSIYPNRAYSTTIIDKQIEETIALLKSLGRAPTDLGIAQDVK